MAIYASLMRSTSSLMRSTTTHISLRPSLMRSSIITFRKAGKGSIKHKYLESNAFFSHNIPKQSHATVSDIP